MKKLIILLTLALSFSFADAKNYTPLKDKDYKNLPVAVVVQGKANTKLVKDEVTSSVKLLLLRNGIKPLSPKNIVNGGFLVVYVTIAPFKDDNYDVFSIQTLYIVGIQECADRLGIDRADVEQRLKLAKVLSDTPTPAQGDYNSLGYANTKRLIIEEVEKTLKKFIVDYLESNL